MIIEDNISDIFRLIYKAILMVQLKIIFICNWQWLKKPPFDFEPKDGFINTPKHVANTFF